MSKPIGTRVRIVEDPGELHGIPTATPEVSKPHLGRLGTIVEYVDRWGWGVTTPRILLDDGSELLGAECWWKAIEEKRP